MNEDKIFKCALECGHTVGWKEPIGDASGGLPYVGLPIWCEECQADCEIVECEPYQVIVEDILLSENEPYVTGCSPSGWAWQMGDRLSVFYDTASGSWGYCFYGVSRDGNAYEGDDITGFASADEARKDALDWLATDKADRLEEIDVIE